MMTVPVPPGRAGFPFLFRPVRAAVSRELLRWPGRTGSVAVMRCFCYSPGAPRHRRDWRPWRPARWVRWVGPADAPGRPGAVFSSLQFPLGLVVAPEDLPACRPVERVCGPPGSGPGHVRRGAPAPAHALRPLRPLRSPDLTGRTPGGAGGAAAPSPTAVSGPARRWGASWAAGPRPLRPAALPPAAPPFCPQRPVEPFCGPGRLPKASRGPSGLHTGLWGPHRARWAVCPLRFGPALFSGPPAVFEPPIYKSASPRERERDVVSIYIGGVFF